MATLASISRRDLLQKGSGLIISFALSGAFAHPVAAQTGVAAFFAGDKPHFEGR